MHFPVYFSFGIELAPVNCDVLKCHIMHATSTVVVFDYASRQSRLVARETDISERQILNGVSWGAVVLLAKDNLHIKQASPLDVLDAYVFKSNVPKRIVIAGTHTKHSIVVFVEHIAITHVHVPQRFALLATVVAVAT